MRSVLHVCINMILPLNNTRNTAFWTYDTWDVIRVRKVKLIVCSTNYQCMFSHLDSVQPRLQFFSTIAKLFLFFEGLCLFNTYSIGEDGQKPLLASYFRKVHGALIIFPSRRRAISARLPSYVQKWRCWHSFRDSSCEKKRLWIPEASKLTSKLAHWFHAQSAAR